MIDTNTTVEAKFHLRWMTVRKLKEIMDQLDDDYIVVPNRVGNLSVRNNDDLAIGFIDFNEERFETDWMNITKVTIDFLPDLL